MPRSNNSKYFKKALLIAIPGTLIIGALVFAILLSSPNNEKNNTDANNLTDKTVTTTAKIPDSKKSETKEKQAKSSAQTDKPPKEINADSGNNRQNSTQNGNASNQAASPTAPEIQSNNAQTKETEEGAKIENSTGDRDVAEDAQNTEPNGAKNTSEIERMKESARQYSTANISAGDPNKGGYPYSERCPEQIDAFADQWGMYICENVSYAAWKVYSTYGYMPYWGGRGNAKQWPANARAAGYVVSSVPKPGSVGISTSGAYGHAVWVEAVSDNRVYVSQYNAKNAATNYKAGEYSEQWADQGAYQYIYFSSKEAQDANE